jgi:hypothetical protein
MTSIVIFDKTFETTPSARPPPPLLLLLLLVLLLVVEVNVVIGVTGATNVTSSPVLKSDFRGLPSSRERQTASGRQVFRSERDDRCSQKTVESSNRGTVSNM